ncbi:hypothetical protein GGR50DRAFT_396344 [Xylaria sp. CBS 124048]|nr:hypothetical protein GGR50DRAFT_396344 [Xylaria sp. CBS 124048]
MAPVAPRHLAFPYQTARGGYASSSTDGRRHDRDVNPSATSGHFSNATPNTLDPSDRTNHSSSGETVSTAITVPGEVPQSLLGHGLPEPGRRRPLGAHHNRDYKSAVPHVPRGPPPTESDTSYTRGASVISDDDILNDSFRSLQVAAPSRHGRSVSSRSRPSAAVSPNSTVWLPEATGPAGRLPASRVKRMNEDLLGVGGQFDNDLPSRRRRR